MRASKHQQPARLSAGGPGWVAVAAEALRTYARRRREPFTIDAARRALAPHLSNPADARAWGAVTRAALKADYVVQVGHAPARSSNGSAKPTYVAGGRA